MARPAGTTVSGVKVVVGQCCRRVNNPPRDSTVYRGDDSRQPLIEVTANSTAS